MKIHWPPKNKIEMENGKGKWRQKMGAARRIWSVAGAACIMTWA